ncbi:MAG: hypothetical protein WDO68_29230 [Gammaproteobacteria bacterium]
MTDLTELSSRIEIIERGYEYLLAYAAQGRQDDQGTEARARLTEMFATLNGLGELFAKVTVGSGAAPVVVGPFLDAVKQDAAKARGAIGLVLSRPAIGSLLVDNLNASIHLRALLTDCFLVEQAFK